MTTLIILINTLIVIFFPVIGMVVFALELFYLEEKIHRNIVIFFIALSAGILGYSIDPPKYFDLSVRFDVYDKLKGTPIKILTDSNYYKGSYIYYLFVWLLANNGISKHVIPFVSTFFYTFGVLIYFYEYVYEEIKDITMRVVSFALLAFILNLNLMIFISQVRGPLATGIFSLGVLAFEKKKRIIGIILLAMTVKIHFMAIPLIVAYVIYKSSVVRIVIEKNSKIFVIAFIGLAVVGLKLMAAITPLLPPYLAGKIDEYVLGQYSSRGSVSIFYYLFFVVWYFYLLFLVFVDKSYYNIKSFMIIILGLISLNFMSKTNLVRYLWYTSGFQYVFTIKTLFFNRDSKFSSIKIIITVLFPIVFNLILFKDYRETLIPLFTGSLFKSSIVIFNLF